MLMLAAVVSAPVCMAQAGLDFSQPPMVSRLLHRMGPLPSDPWFFSRVREVISDAEGRVYALEDTDQTIRVFSPEGRLLRTLGKKGSGPGEFTGARKLQVLGDTLWVYDNQNARLTAFSTAAGKLLTNTRRGPLPLRFLSLSPTGVFATQTSHDARVSAFNPRKVDIVHAPAGHASERAVASYTRWRAPLTFRAYAEGKAIIAANRLGQLNTAQPLESSTLMKAGSGGRSIVFIVRESNLSAARSNPFANSGGSPLLRIVEVGPQGDTLLRLDLSVPALRVTNAHVRAVVDSLTRSDIIARGQRWVGDPSEIRDSLYQPRIWPSTTEFFVGDDGTIWLRQPSPPSREARFWRVRQNGTVLPSVGVASGLIIHHVSEQRIWGVREDADGVPTIEVHEIVPR